MSIIVPPVPNGTSDYVIIEVTTGQIIARADDAATAFVIGQQNSRAYRLLRVCEVHVLAGGTVHAPLIAFRDGVAIGEKTYVLPKSLPFIS